MINIFDRTLKIIARNYAETFLKLAFPNQSVRLLGTIENVEISLSVKPVDFVHRVRYDDTEYLFHLEFQLTHKAELPKRTFITSAELTDQYDLPVLTVMLYLRPRQNEIPAQYQTRLGQTVVTQFEYTVIKLWDYVEAIRRGEFPELAPLLTLLIADPDEALLAEERSLIMHESNPQKRAELLAAAVAMATRYFNNEFLWQFFREELEQMKSATFINDWIEQGIEQGIQQGLKQGLKQGVEQGIQQGIQQGIERGVQRAVIEVLQTRFKILPKSLQARINQFEELSTLNLLLRQAVMVETLQDFESWLPPATEEESATKVD